MKLNRKKLRNRLLIALGVIALMTYGSLMRNFKRDYSTLFYNGTILTMDPELPQVEAVYIRRGKIEVLGSLEECQEMANEGCRMIDLKGRTLLPGFIDSHTHPVLSAFAHGLVDLSGFTHQTEEEIWTHFSKELQNYSPGEWVVCKGLDPILVKGLKPPHISFLDSIAPNNPVVILSQSLHSYWANQLAFDAVGIDSETPDPSSNSYYGRDEAGKLTGFIAEQVAFQPFSDTFLSAMGKEAMVQAMVEVLEEYAKNGNTSITTLGLTSNDPNVLRLYHHLSAGRPKFLNQVLVKLGFFPKRKPTVRHFMYVRHDAVGELLPVSVDNGDDFFKILGVKLWYDGSPYTGSMYLKEPYMESELTLEGFHIPPNYRGEALIPKDSFSTLLTRYHTQGWQIAVHTQGDLAIEETLHAFWDMGKNRGTRHRIEHCLLLGDESITQMKELGISPSFHINHLYYYGQALQGEILGEARAQKILPIQSALEEGLRVSLHADQPMFESRPLHLLHTAVNRMTKEGDTLGLDQALTIQQGLEALTTHAAWQVGMEDKIGMIKEGYLGDVVMLNQNPFKVPKDSIKDIQVIATFVHGNRVFGNWRKN